LQPRTRPKAFTAVAVLAALSAFTAGWASLPLARAQAGRSSRAARPGRPAPGANAAREARFLAAVPPRATLAQIKRLLPPGTRYGKPEVAFGEHVQGTFITIAGPIRGYLVFLSERQRTQFRSGYPDANPTRTRYRPTDPISVVHVVMDDGKIRASTDTKRRIEAVTRYLGRPREKTFLADEDVTVGDGGWQATWRLSRNRTIWCGSDPLSDEAVLVLRFEDNKL